MADDKHSAAGAALTALILEVFRLNGRLVAAGDRLVADVGLTSARWQVLGAIHFADGPQTVSQIARRMGLTRQTVQRIANELEVDGIVAFAPNPAHRRASLVTMTRKGQAMYLAADRRQIPWANGLAKGLSRAELGEALRILTTLRSRLEIASD